MSDSFEVSRQALAELKSTDAIDWVFKSDWTDEDLANMHKLNEQDLAECMLFATLEGNERLVRALVEQRGLVKVEVKTLETRPPTYFLNGKQVSFDGIKFLGVLEDLDHFHEVDDQKTPSLNSLIAMIIEFGMTGLIEPGESYPLLLRNTCTNAFEDKYNKSIFKGELPELSDEVLRNPALAVALDNRPASALIRESFRPLLCWASADMVEDYPDDLTPLRMYQTVEGHGTLQEWRDRSGEPGNLEFECITLGIDFPGRGPGFASALIDAMAPESVKLGFSDPTGRVLCETTTDFLLMFPMRPGSDESVEAAEQFVKGYCPILIMHQQVAALCRGYGYELPYQGTPQIFTNSMHSNFEAIFSVLDEKNPLYVQAKNMMTRDQWRTLAKKAESTIGITSLLSLWKAFEIDNTGLQLEIDTGGVQLLANKRYKFSSETEVFGSYTTFEREPVGSGETRLLVHEKCPFVVDYFQGTQNTKELARALKIFKKIQAANLWPTENGWPKSLSAALQQCLTYDLDDFQNNDAMLFRTYLSNHGAQACVNAVTSPEQWDKLITVFGSDEMQPYLKMMPKSAKGRVLESSLGL
jgi:hypothetical protein